MRYDISYQLILNQQDIGAREQAFSGYCVVGGGVCGWLEGLIGGMVAGFGGVDEGGGGICAFYEFLSRFPPSNTSSKLVKSVTAFVGI